MVEFFEYLCRLPKALSSEIGAYSDNKSSPIPWKKRAPLNGQILARRKNSGRRLGCVKDMLDVTHKGE